MVPGGFISPAPQSNIREATMPKAAPTPGEAPMSFVTANYFVQNPEQSTLTSNMTKEEIIQMIFKYISTFECRAWDPTPTPDLSMYQVTVTINDKNQHVTVVGDISNRCLVRKVLMTYLGLLVSNKIEVTPGVQP
jgi:mannosyltransferase OCH1-like enzyme